MPVTGCHSVIDRPDQVRRVTPPITTIAKIIAQQTSSQIATDRCPALLRLSSYAGVAAAKTVDTTLLLADAQERRLPPTPGRDK